MKHRVVFFGTPTIASVILEELYKTNNIDVIAVWTQPDRMVDRKKEVVFSPVKEFCIQNKIDVYQPENINDDFEKIKELNPDIIITCAYGQFIGEKILSIPKYKCVNFHASLLPKLRGGAPIHWSIINDEESTGMTLMFMEKKMDAGNIIKQYEIKIDNNDTYYSLYKKLCNLSVDIVKNDIDILFDDNIISISQDEKYVTFGYNIKKEETYINFNENSRNIYNLIRGLNDKPVAKLIYRGITIKVFESIETNIKSNKEPGTIVSISKDGLQIATKDFDILIKKIQLPSKKQMHISDIINGKNIFILGDIIK